MNDNFNPVIKAKNPEESAALQANIKLWDDEKQRAATMPIPAGFIQVTDTNNVKLLVAVGAISLVQQAGTQSALTLTVPRADGAPYEVEVKEKYLAIMEDLAQAHTTRSPAVN